MYSFGDRIKVTIFGQSHSAAIGVVLDGIPAGKKIDLDRVYAHMRRRAPGRDRFSTQRKETDMPEVLSGIVDGVTCGAPICTVIHNSNTKSKDYDNIKYVPRPGHADFTAYVKFEGSNDIRGGGQFSGRMTAPLCFAGAVCMQLLEEKGITIGAHISSIHGIEDEGFNPVLADKELLDSLKDKQFCVVSDKAGEAMKAEIDKARMEQNSVGGTVECAIIGMPQGIGDALFGGIEGKLSSAVFSIPAVKGIEFGAGFSASRMYGSENNDEFCIEEGKVVTKTNNHGGILGGISSGMPIIFNVAFKPTPSIAKPQKSVNLKTGAEEELIIEGRHDPCIVQRAVPVIEATAAIAILDLIGE